MDLGSEKPFQLRVGINTGFCTVGNFGSEDRMDYTVVGNEANLAARLQSHAELGGIVVAHETSSLIKVTIRNRSPSPSRASLTRCGFIRSSAYMMSWKRTAGLSERSARVFGCLST
jgi:class 3 adenylate cyclase